MARVGGAGKAIKLESFDCRGGSSPASTIFPKLPSFVDSEFSGSDLSLSPTSSHGSHAPVHDLSLMALRCRITIFEGLLCDYKALLVHMPSLFETVPSPFSPCTDTAWYAQVAERRAALSILRTATVLDSTDGDELVARISKRMRIHIALLRTFMTHMQQDPQDYYALPNPCDPAMSKRVWERVMHQQRQKFRAIFGGDSSNFHAILLLRIGDIAAYYGDHIAPLWQVSSTFRNTKIGLDARGGSISIAFACTGEEVLRLDVTDDSTVMWMKQQVGTYLRHPPFGVTLLVDGRCASNHLTWSTLGKPYGMLLVLKQKTDEHSPDLLQAIVDDDVEALTHILELGQDPNGWLWDAADQRFHHGLLYATDTSSIASVRLLLEGFANPNVLTDDRRSALHAAVAHDQEEIASVLLQWGADPNLQNSNGDSPLHLAVVYQDVVFSACLLSAGADPLLCNSDGQAPFYYAGAGLMGAMCIHKCAARATPTDWIIRHLPSILSYCSGRRLWAVCRSVSQQQRYWDVEDVLGGGDLPFDHVSFVMAYTGSEICVLSASEESTVMSLKQGVALHLGHLPFAVRLLVEGQPVPVGGTWPALGSPRVMQVVLAPITTNRTIDLVNAIQEQQHDTVIEILEAGQDPNCQWMGRWRAEPITHVAASRGHFYSLHLLLAGFANPNVATSDGRTALHLGVLANSPMTLHVLMDHGANVHARDSQGATPLHFAAVTDSVALVQQLLSAGADPLLPDAHNDPPLSWWCGANVRAALMDSCWSTLSYPCLLRLNMRALRLYVQCGQLRQLCRSLWDCLGGSPAFLLHQYIFREPAAPADRPRMWLQLKLFYVHIEPLSSTLGKYPHLFWVLPVPFDVSHHFEEWKVQLLAAKTFIQLLQLGELSNLEAALTTWFWPEIIQDLSLLDVLSTAKTSSSKKVRKRQLSSAVLFFSTLARPYGQTVHKKVTSMGTSVFYRHVLLQRFLQTCQSKPRTKSKVHPSSVLLLSAALGSHFGDCLGGALTDPAAYVHLCNNKERARSRKMQKLTHWTQSHGGMELPLRGDSVDAMVPYRHENFAPCVDITTLAWLHPHDRDRHVRFESEGHVYYIRGKQTNGSVTGMIHAFARPFDADEAISNMMVGDRWPRAGYLRPFFGETVLKRVRQVDADLVLALLDSPRNDTWISNRLQSLRTNFPDIVQSLVFGPHEIKRMWEANRIDAALRGTHMHFWFEAHVNGYVVPKTSPEFSMLETFLQDMQGWRAFRTEWIIFGEEENIAGSIDLTAINPTGQLALID